jgi:hypothetical protein
VLRGLASSLASAASGALRDAVPRNNMATAAAASTALAAPNTA